MELPAEIWHEIVYYANFDTLIKLVTVNKSIYNHCNTTQFWINKFDDDGFTIFNDPRTVDDYTKQYKLMIEAKNIVDIIIKITDIEREFDNNHPCDPTIMNKRNGQIYVMWESSFEDYTKTADGVVTSKLKLAINDNLIIEKERTGLKYYNSNVNILFQDDDKYQVIYEMVSEDGNHFVDAETIMSLYDVKQFLVNVQYVTTAGLAYISIYDEEEQLYYENRTDLDGHSDHSYQYVKKFFTRWGIRQTLEHQNKKYIIKFN